ncbi:MAG: glycosyltransferase, partial [Calditrichaeota bacterium]
MILYFPAMIPGIISFGIYLFFSWWLHRGLSRAIRRQPDFSHNGPHVGISIIIAAHNEAGAISETLSSLLKQDYPRDRFEIIVVADRCTDRTAEEVRRFEKDAENLRLFEIPAVPEAVSPKKYALQQGIQYARFRYLIMMDADCRVKSGYLQTFNIYFRNGTDVLINVPKMKPGNSWLYHYLHPERLFTWSISAAAAGNDNPFLAFGTTWGYTREIYEKSGGLTPLLRSLSGDDDLLVYRMGQAGARTDFCFLKEGWGETRFPASLKSFIIQRRRHHSAGRYYAAGPRTGYLFYHLSNYMLWFLPLFFLPSLIFLVLKWLIDYLTLRRSAIHFRESLSLRNYLFFE